MADFAEKFGDTEDGEKYLEMADKAKQSFNETFGTKRKNVLFDVIERRAKRRFRATESDFCRQSAEHDVEHRKSAENRRKS